MVLSHFKSLHPLVYLTFVTTVASNLGVISGTRFSWIGWLVPSVFALVYLVVEGRRTTFPVRLWLPWMLFAVTFALTRHTENAIQRTIIMLAPIIVGMAVSSRWASTRSLRAYFSSADITLVVLLVVLLSRVVFDSAEVLNFFAAESITAAFLATILWCRFLATPSLRVLVLWALAVAVPLIAVTRGPTIAIALSMPLVLYPLQARSRLVVLLLAAGSALAAFYSPWFQEKFFFSGGGTLGDLVEGSEAIRFSGRMEMWQALLTEIPNAPVLGHGANASQQLVEQIIEGVGHPHNDILRLAYDYGFLGVGLYLFTMLFQIRALLTIAREAKDRLLRLSCYAAASAFVPFGLLMLTDNVLLYAAFFGNVHFCLIGLCYSRVRVLRRLELLPVIAQRQQVA